jgi:choice-of-anchor A domain-containing protein
MINNNAREARLQAGIPYNDIIWYDVVGQPFGTASNFNAIIFGDANNIVDTKGAMAVGGDFVSSRGLSLGYGNDLKLTGTGYSPDLVRFLVGGDVAMQGPLVVIGHVVAGGNFRAASGSTYMIGKDGSSNQVQELTQLYQANNGSRYWRLSDRDNHYLVSSYDVPRYIPASRIDADVSDFFEEARESIMDFHDCIVGLTPNGTTTLRYHEWILRGNDPNQNVFVIDARPNGILNKEIRFEIPEGSRAIVILRTGNNAHLQYGLWGEENLANRTLYVFEDARNIHMEVPAAIWGSILAPQAMFHAHQTGGTVSGNAALGGFAVSPTSGFEFHLYPFIGGVVCGEIIPAPPVDIPIPLPTPLPTPRPEPIPPMPMPTPRPEPMPPMPMPTPRPEPIPPRPMPTPRPEPIPPRPMPTPRPEPIPPMPLPTPIPVPTCPPCEECPPPSIPIPCPECPEIRPTEPCPVCEECRPCPACEECKPCPPNETTIIIEPLPIPVPILVEEEKCKRGCLVEAGVIFGCIWGCSCCHNHGWEIKLYKACGDRKRLLHCASIYGCGCFEFKVPYDDFYRLEVCPTGSNANAITCKPMLTLKNVGVKSLMID